MSLGVHSKNSNYKQKAVIARIVQPRLLIRHSLSNEIKQAEVLSAFQTIVAFSTLI